MKNSTTKKCRLFNERLNVQQIDPILIHTILKKEKICQ